MEKTVDTTEILWKASSPASTILRLLQRQGPTSVKQLEHELGVSTNAVREQLTQLQAAELIHVTRLSQGAGRPLHLYSLTTRAQQLLSPGADTLLNLLLEEILAQDGVAKIRRLLDGVSQRLAHKYVGNPATTLTERLHDLQVSLAQHSMPLTMVEHGDSLELHAWSCPYVDVATDHREICDMEAHVLEQALGQPVHLGQRIVDGAVGCCFVVGKGCHTSHEETA